jgi:ABC-type lipoprotein export system ATPase subunit
VFQQFNLVPSLTVAANVAIQARMSGRHDPARDANLIDRLGLSALTPLPRAAVRAASSNAWPSPGPWQGSPT